MKLSDPLLNLNTTTDISQAARWLKSGQLLCYPTESVWGIGCDPFDESAVAQLLAIKQRPVDKGMIVVTDDIKRIAPLLASLNTKQRQSVTDSWQPLLNRYPSNQQAINSQVQQAQTWLLPLPESLEVTMPSWITGIHNSVAVRVIAHPLIQQLCAQMVSVDNPFGFIVSTSCNPAGKPPALSLAQAQAYFDNSNDIGQDNSANNVGYLIGETLGYQLPSQIRNALTGQVIR